MFCYVLQSFIQQITVLKERFLFTCFPKLKSERIMLLEYVGNANGCIGFDDAVYLVVTVHKTDEESSATNDRQVIVILVL